MASLFQPSAITTSSFFMSFSVPPGNMTVQARLWPSILEVNENASCLTPWGPGMEHDDPGAPPPSPCLGGLLIDQA